MSTDLIHNVLEQLKVELSDEFDMNFQRKAFFDDPWPATQANHRRGTLMMRSGRLRKSISGEVRGDSIRFTSEAPYASIHNEGGTLKVTAKMKKFFWAMWFKYGGKEVEAQRKRAKEAKAKGEKLRKQPAIPTADLADYYKKLALIPIGSKLKIPQRQFIGAHPKVDEAVKQVMNDHLPEIEKYMDQLFKRR